MKPDMMSPFQQWESQAEFASPVTGHWQLADRWPPEEVSVGGARMLQAGVLAADPCEIADQQNTSTRSNYGTSRKRYDENRAVARVCRFGRPKATLRKRPLQLMTYLIHETD